MIDDPGQFFSESDREQMSEHGIAFDDAVRQLEILRDPVARFRTLDRPALSGDGIKRVELRGIPDLLVGSAAARRAGRVSKFVPASGAATRMFQKLLQALDDFEQGSIDEEGRRNIGEFLDAIPLLALRHELVKEGLLPDSSAHEADHELVERLKVLLREEGAGLASRPKGLVPFHDDGSRGRTAFEEHLREALLYTKDESGTARVHFTVPDESRGNFEALLEQLREPLESSYGGKLDVSFSSQLKSTDTISVAGDGNPFREADGRLLVRPGGHGSLLQNLESSGGDVVVIKNIDNLVPERNLREIAHWKNVLIGYLVMLQETAHIYLRELHRSSVETHWLGPGLLFAEQHLSIDVPEPVRTGSEKIQRDFLARMLDRPVRVCGVVKNEGEPGGGPFWVRQADGRSTLQIVESAEVDMNDVEQSAVWNASTHFNPVDLVVGLRNWKGEPFDLDRYTDPEAVFRVRKSSDGRPLTALERPGLWNGAMADWTTIFVEVPLVTFAPVKTIFDLLRPEHL